MYLRMDLGLGSSNPPSSGVASDGLAIPFIARSSFDVFQKILKDTKRTISPTPHATPAPQRLNGQMGTTIAADSAIEKKECFWETDTWGRQGLCLSREKV